MTKRDELIKELKLYFKARERAMLERIEKPLKLVKCTNGGSPYEHLCQAIEKALSEIAKAREAE
jgi:hypothetical protein